MCTPSGTLYSLHFEVNQWPVLQAPKHFSCRLNYIFLKIYWNVYHPNLAVSRETATQVSPESKLNEMKVRLLTSGLLKPFTNTAFIFCKPENYLKWLSEPFWTKSWSRCLLKLFEVTIKKLQLVYMKWYWTTFTEAPTW